MIAAPVVDGRRFERFVRELRGFAPYYTPDMNLSDAESAGLALMKIAAHLAETIAVRLDRAPDKNVVAFLDKLGIVLLPAQPARAAIAFRLNAALQSPVAVPAGARVTAQGKDGEIPFETNAEFVAIPGALQALYSFDPSRDVIFRPPPDFLKQEPRSPSELQYDVVSFSSAGIDRLQLSHVTALAPGAFLLIDASEKHVVRKLGDGNIVTLTTPLGRDVQPGAIVQPIRDFEVFDGIDLQEHILYMGHAGLLTIKEEAELTIRVGLQRNGSQPLDIVWQFFTKREDAPPEEEEDWHDLTLDADGTAGFTTSGDVVLVKPADFEIKSPKVFGKESRWIRGKLRTKLTGSADSLPRIDSIAIAVKSRREGGIPADQGFYNATPLDVQIDENIGFFPFGAEPRQFDQFYLASKEAFSKRAADVSLHFTLDLQTLAGPSVVNSSAGLLAYSIGVRRKLFELSLTGGTWHALGSPPDSPYLPVEDSVPAAITDGGASVFVFVTTQDLQAQDAPSKVWVHLHQAGQETGNWTDLGAPGSPPAKITFGPAAIRLSGTGPFARVFVVADDGNLYSKSIAITGAPQPAWDSHAAPPGVLLNSPPFVVLAGTSVLAFVNGKDATGYRAVHRYNLQSNAWVTLKPGNVSFDPASRPFAIPFGSGTDAKVFVSGLEQNTLQWKLYECSTASQTGDVFHWDDLGWPSPQRETTVDGISPDAHAPAAHLETPAESVTKEGKHVFIRDAANRLFERLDDDQTLPTWEDRTRAGDPELRESAAVQVEPGPVGTRLHVFSASSRNSVVHWLFEVSNGAPAQRRAVRLTDDASDDDDAYPAGKTLAYTDSGGNPESANVAAYDGALRVVRLQTAVTELPDDTTAIEIDGTPVGDARKGANRLLALHAPVSRDPAAAALALRLDDQFVDVDFYSRITGVVSLSSAAPAAATYALYVTLAETPTEYPVIAEAGSVPELSWEYWNGRGWLSLPGVIDGTRNLLTNGAITFPKIPLIQPTEVAGQENVWIRARLVGGDYGRETFRIEKDKVVSEKSSLRPPKVKRLRITYEAAAVPPEVCLTFNNLDYLDQTAAARIDGAHFPPFERLEDTSLTAFFGFDHGFRTGPVQLLIDAAEREIDPSAPPAFAWTFRRDHTWKDLPAEDGSLAFTRQGIAALSATDDLTEETRFGESLFWVKASLREDRVPQDRYPRPLLRGVYLNTAYATQGETITEEIVGSSDGEPDQIRPLQHGDVLPGEDIRVRETLSVEEQQQIERDQGKDAIAIREDLGGTWVRWREIGAFFEAGPDDRCYSIDRAAGLVRFGDGVHGRIPPAGTDNIRAFTYRTGGGTPGNVEPGQISTLATSVEGVEAVFNPTAAGGGADKTDTKAMLTIGPRRISNRNRAVSPEDFEELAYEASRQVAKARCLAATNLERAGVGRPDPCDPAQRHEAHDARGWVSLIIVPTSHDPLPCPSIELRHTVHDYLTARAPSLVAAADRIVVRPPDYVVVTITADLFVLSLDKASAVEKLAIDALTKFTHPLDGGPEGDGWEFGRPIRRSDVFAVLERIQDMVRVQELKFVVGTTSYTDGVDVEPNQLIAGLGHRVSIKKA